MLDICTHATPLATPMWGCELIIMRYTGNGIDNTFWEYFQRTLLAITGSAVALHCCKTHAKINRKMGNSTPCKIVTPENIILKLCIRDYVGELTHHANFGFNRSTGGFSPNRRNVTTLWLFWLSCPYLFFSILRPGWTAGPIFTIYGSNDVFPRKDGLLGVRTIGDHILREHASPPKKRAWIGNFKPKRQNIKITISPKV